MPPLRKPKGASPRKPPNAPRSVPSIRLELDHPRPKLCRPQLYHARYRCHVRQHLSRLDLPRCIAAARTHMTVPPKPPKSFEVFRPVNGHAESTQQPPMPTHTPAAPSVATRATHSELSSGSLAHQPCTLHLESAVLDRTVGAVIPALTSEHVDILGDAERPLHTCAEHIVRRGITALAYAALRVTRATPAYSAYTSSSLTTCRTVLGPQRCAPHAAPNARTLALSCSVLRQHATLPTLSVLTPRSAVLARLCGTAMRLPYHLTQSERTSHRTANCTDAIKARL